MPAAPLRQALVGRGGRHAASAPAAAEAGQPQRTEPAPEQQQQQGQEKQELDESQVQRQRAARLWSEIQLLAVRAQSLEASGRREEAAGVLSAALARLEGQSHEAFALVPLRQLLWHTLHTTGRHGEALEQAQAVYDAVAARYGDDAAELQLVAVRLGMSRAAAGDIEGGVRLIYTATPVLQHNLELLLEQADRLAAQAAAEQRGAAAAAARTARPPAGEGGEGEGEGDGQAPPSQAEVAAVALQEMIDKVAGTLGEANYYGSLLTVEHAVESGLQRGAWQGGGGHGSGGRGHREVAAPGPPERLQGTRVCVCVCVCV
jgi:hypothetical protein